MENEKEKITVEEAEEVKTEETKTAEPIESEADKANALAEEYKRKWYAVTAEYDNYRKRTQLTASQKYAEGVADILLKILPVGDNLERAISVCSDEKIRQGLEMTKANFDKVLAGEGVEAFDPTGEAFDPYTAVAIAAVPAGEDEEDNVVKTTFEKGYKKGDKILRLAKVMVAKKN